MSSNIATFNNFTFSYDTKTIEIIDTNDYVEVYNDVIILNSNNDKFKINDKIEQISIEIKLNFEHNDGTPY